MTANLNSVTVKLGCSESSDPARQPNNSLEGAVKEHLQLRLGDELHDEPLVGRLAEGRAALAPLGVPLGGHAQASDVTVEPRRDIFSGVNQFRSKQNKRLLRKNKKDPTD